MLGSRRAQRTSSHLQKKKLGRESGKLVLAMLAINGVAHLVLGMSWLPLATQCSRRKRRRCRRRQQHRAKIEGELAENGLSHPLDLRGCACVVAGNATSFLQSIGVCSAYVRRRHRSSPPQSTCSGRLVGYSCGAVAWMLLQVVSGVRHICAAEQSLT